MIIDSHLFYEGELVRLKFDVLGIHPHAVFVSLILQAYLNARSFVEFTTALLHFDSRARGRPTDETIQRGVGCH
jgi:hypothetical protein